MITVKFYQAIILNDQIQTDGKHLFITGENYDECFENLIFYLLALNKKFPNHCNFSPWYDKDTWSVRYYSDHSEYSPTWGLYMEQYDPSVPKKSMWLYNLMEQ